MVLNSSMDPIEVFGLSENYNTLALVQSDY